MNSPNKSWFLGVDGGQSSTAALIGDDAGHVRGVGHGGPCNHVSSEESRERFLHAVGGAIRAALSSAELPNNTVFETTCLGLSGGPHDKEALVRELIHARKYEITNDALIALTGATGGQHGVIAIAGTGSIAYGRNAAGKIARAGGWGYVFGDEGGAFDVARQALRAALRFEEGWGQDTALREVLREATGAADMNDLLHGCYTPKYPRSKVATWAKLVDQAARQGDYVAQDILKNAAHSLAALAAAVGRQLFHRSETVRATYIGGIFESDIVRQQFKLLMELDSAMELHPPSYGPAAGALIEAYRLAGLHLNLQDAPIGV